MRKYVELEKRMLSRPTEELLLEIAAARLTIEADEPPVLHVLNTICHNEMARAIGLGEKHYVKIGAFQSLVSQLFDFRESSLQYKEDKQEIEPVPTP
jgi:hypothetical protein